MDGLFQKDKSIISIYNIFDEGGLVRKAVATNYAPTACDVKFYKVVYNNLDVIISYWVRLRSGV